MGNPTFYWYPDPYGTIEKLDLGEGLSDLQGVHLDSLEASSESIAGYETLIPLRRRGRVRLVYERFGDGSVRRGIEALVNHLKRGGTCGFCTDSAKVVAVVVESALARGDTSLPFSWRVLDYEGTQTLAADDEVVLTSPSPEYQQEIGVVSSQATNTITLTAGLRYTYESLPVIVRYDEFFPLLRMPPSERAREVLTSDHRLVWTLDMTLIEDVAALWLIAGTNGPLTTTVKTDYTESPLLMQQRELGSEELTKGGIVPVPLTLT